MKSVFVPSPTVKSNEGIRVANLMAVELAAYGITPSKKLIAKIGEHDFDTAKTICNKILRSYTIGDLNPPLFKGWEDRTHFSFTEIVVQICGYVLQIDGNDLTLNDPDYMDRLLSNVKFKKEKKLKLAKTGQSKQRFLDLVNSQVPLDKSALSELVELSKTYFTIAPDYIKSQEARTAVLMGYVQDGLDLSSALRLLKCSSDDVLRYAAALNDFDSVKLPSDVKYGNLKWRDRVSILSFLNGKSLQDLCEDMAMNRSAWTRFFKHIHLFSQKDFENRFLTAVGSAFLSVGSKVDVANPAIAKFLRSNRKYYDVTASGNLAYRTFASRVQTAVHNKDMKAFVSEVSDKPGYVLRNLATLSHICTKKTERQFVDIARKALLTANPSVLLSLIQINVNSDYRIIDSKGNTTVEPADYNPVISEIQLEAERVLYERFGVKGKISVSKDLRNKVVPFLSTNSDLDRGTRIKFNKTDYLYFFMHWVQSTQRTDLDHSYMCFDDKWHSSTVYFGNQANSFITQSGDITSAPAPKGGTEYGKISLKKIPKSTRYIVPVINVYSGDVFSENKEAYAGFMFSNSNKFSIASNHVRYDLTQPAQLNVPFVIDVKEKEIIIIDYNNRHREGLTAHSSRDTIKNMISAVKSKNTLTVQRFADILSGDADECSLSIVKTASKNNEVSVDNLQTLVTI